jgi:hypothetical protein
MSDSLNRYMVNRTGKSHRFRKCETNPLGEKT